MSLIKYRVREVAADFGMAPKDVSEAVGKFFEKPKSNSQVLTDEELNGVFDYITQKNQIASIEQVFAPARKPEPEKKPEAEKRPEAEKKPGARKPETKAPEARKPGNKQEPRPQAPKAPEAREQPKENKQPERRRERRVVDTSAVQVNSARFDDRVDTLVSEREQKFSGGKL